MRKACYKDLMEKYENPMEHACDIEEGQVFITNGWCKPVGMCDSHDISIWRQGHLQWMDEK